MIAIKTDLVFPLIVFCIVSLFTPGPNNKMLMVSGLNFGLKRTLPHIFGVVIGFAFLVFCVGLGLGVIFTAWPLAYTILKYAGAAYLFYLAWVIASADPTAPHGSSKRKRPFTFIEAAAYQWINPKGCVMAVGSISTYAAVAGYPYNAVIISLLFGTLGIGSSFTWACFGTGLQHLLKNPRIVRVFNIVMALLLVASIIPIFVE